MSADWSTPLRRIVTDGDDEDLAYAIGALEEVVRLMLGDLRASGRPHLAQRHAGPCEAQSHRHSSPGGDRCLPDAMPRPRVLQADGVSHDFE